MSCGLVLRLAGPIAAFGTTATFHDRPTENIPTRSALIGLFAAAAGRPRHQAMTADPEGQHPYRDLSFTVRTDRPGTLHTDFHTVGGGYRDRQLSTAEGPQRPRREATLVSRRTYLADAVFTIAVTGPAPLLDLIAHHLEHPRYAPCLGRRNCVPAGPLLLRSDVEDPVAHLHERVPLSLARPPHPGQDTVPVTFHHDREPDRPDRTTAQIELNDDPLDFTPRNRRYRPRTLWRTTTHLPADLYAGPRPLARLAAYMHAETHP
ncbi:type I-E CRISPR-associated protein Cas5/CasD [Streptomyces sp. NPDC102364]|uniref:type I-E CRISPR-associated protein Cas5/CasD n=1 Tax=Streptomyces sp. NPDC102364 TaxID=3366161 RepID=UPI0038180BE1